MNAIEGSVLATTCSVERTAEEEVTGLLISGGLGAAGAFENTGDFEITGALATGFADGCFRATSRPLFFVDSTMPTTATNRIPMTATPAPTAIITPSGKAELGGEANSLVGPAFGLFVICSLGMAGFETKTEDLGDGGGEGRLAGALAVDGIE